MKKGKILWTVGATILVVVGAWASPAYGGVFELHTIESFVTILIQKGIIPSPQAEKAKEIVQIIEQVEGESEIVPQLNAEKVKVTVSAFAEHANLEFELGTDIVDVVLLVQNTTEETVQLEAKRRCQVVYRIYDDFKLLYDSATSEKCQTSERVTYMLDAKEFRTFPITHKSEQYELERGTYQFELEYPGYGKGTKTVTVL